MEIIHNRVSMALSEFEIDNYGNVWEIVASCKRGMNVRYDQMETLQ